MFGETATVVPFLPNGDCRRKNGSRVRAFEHLHTRKQADDAIPTTRTSRLGPPSPVDSTSLPLPQYNAFSRCSVTGHSLPRIATADLCTAFPVPGLYIPAFLGIRTSRSTRSPPITNGVYTEPRPPSTTTYYFIEGTLSSLRLSHAKTGVVASTPPCLSRITGGPIRTARPPCLPTLQSSSTCSRTLPAMRYHFGPCTA